MVHIVTASASGSVMRETHLPRSMSTIPQGQQLQQTPEDGEKKMAAQEASERRLDEYSDRIDYYDRGKGGYPVNGYSEWNDPYVERNESYGGREYYGGYQDRRRVPMDNEYYVEQFQDPRMGNVCARTCGTLPMAKPSGTVPVPSVNIQGSVLGKSVGTLDGRYSGKENASGSGKRVSGKLFKSLYYYCLM